MATATCGAAGRLNVCMHFDGNIFVTVPTVYLYSHARDRHNTGIIGRVEFMSHFDRCNWTRFSMSD